MKAWQDEQRAALRRQGVLPVRGTLSGDIPNYLLKIAPALAFPQSRENEIGAWLPSSGHADATTSRGMTYVDKLAIG